MGLIYDIQISSAMFVTSDGRYLLQLRDDKLGLPLRNHWAFFGGEVEKDENPQVTLVREVFEELTYKVNNFSWFHEAIYVLPRHKHRITKKVYYMVKIDSKEINSMIQNEGADMRLMLPSEILLLPNIAPWDLSVILMHERELLLFG
jgi:8-oxo-dGTP pyrophosphatase MutT (NUDIX family)